MAKIKINADEYPQELGQLQGGQRIKLIITARVAMVSDSLASKEVLLDVDTLEVQPLQVQNREEMFRGIEDSVRTRLGIPMVETATKPAP